MWGLAAIVETGDIGPYARQRMCCGRSGRCLLVPAFAEIGTTLFLP